MVDLSLGASGSELQIWDRREKLMIPGSRKKISGAAEPVFLVREQDERRGIYHGSDGLSLALQQVLATISHSHAYLLVPERLQMWV